MCCLFVYLHFLDCHHVLLSTLLHSLGFVPANHRQLSLSILDQLCDWRWSHLLGKNVKVHSPLVLTLTMTMTMMMLMTMTMTMTMKHLYSSLFTNLVGQDEPVVSLGTYSEFTEYMAAVRGQIWPCPMNIRTYTFCRS